MGTSDGAPRQFGLWFVGDSESDQAACLWGFVFAESERQVKFLTEGSELFYPFSLRIIKSNIHEDLQQITPSGFNYR